MNNNNLEQSNVRFTNINKFSWWWYGITFTIVIILLAAIIYIIHAKLPAIEFNNNYSHLYEFSVDLQFDPYPSTIDIENAYDCNAESLRKCAVDDVTTLFGCKELTVKCVHFDDDTPYINHNNERKIIPKNLDSNDGYCLALTKMPCNPYHGDLTLVSTDTDSNDYLLICTCKNPGYIGNETLLGNCETVFVCNGKIDDINRPLNEINCVCDRNERAGRYSDGLPVCKLLTVDEANKLYADWTALVNFNSDRQMAKTNFNKTVQDNLRVTRLLDPCRNSINDTTIEIPNAVYDSEFGECHLTDYGYPISNGMLDFHTTVQPTTHEVSTDSVFITGEYITMRYSDAVSGIKRMYGLIVDGLPTVKQYANKVLVIQPLNGTSMSNKNVLFIQSKPKSFMAPRCEGRYPTYECQLREYYDKPWLGLPLSGYRLCPGSFLFNKEYWNDRDCLVDRATIKTRRGISMKNSAIKKVDSTMYVHGYQWSKYFIDQKEKNNKSGVTVFRFEADFRKHQQLI